MDQCGGNGVELVHLENGDDLYKRSFTSSMIQDLCGGDANICSEFKTTIRHNPYVGRVRFPSITRRSLKRTLNSFNSPGIELIPRCR